MSTQKDDRNTTVSVGEANATPHASPRALNDKTDENKPAVCGASRGDAPTTSPVETYAPPPITKGGPGGCC
ncbi:hypothetical protein [Pyruvatibacter sp.]|uniref:hypothetical protein n=1 Tax=Pyruvatibacter sp. TaxID=1981328 RepID=UPI0032EC98E2